MEQQLVARMREYLDAGTAMDVDRLDALYDPGFENVRVDLEGRTVTLTKRLFMDRFRALKAQGRGVGESVDDVSFPAAGRHGDRGSVVMRRVEDGLPVLYHFVWRIEDGRPTTLLREFTFERDLSALLALVRPS